MNNVDRKFQADRILYEFGLLKKLEEIGVPHLYSFEKYKSLDVYKAVLENDVVDVEEFLQLFH